MYWKFNFMKEIQELYTQATELHRQNRLNEAKALYEKILRMDPNQVDTLYTFGVLYMNQNQNHQAIVFFKKAISIKPHAAYYNNLGIVLSNEGDNNEAIKTFKKAIELDPNYANAYHNLALVFQKEEKLEQASEMLHKTIAINPHYARAYNTLAIILNKQNKFDEAIKMYEKAISIHPSYADAYYNLGIVFKDLNKLNDAMVMFDKSISIDSNRIDAYWNKSLLLLMLSRLEEGFELYEYRWKLKNNLSLKRNFIQPLWLGEVSLLGKTILVHSEQGFGDTIQFCRYIKKLEALGCKIIFELEQSLVSLLSQIKGVSRFISKGEELPFFDYHCPLLSLPFAFKTSLETIPSFSSYLKADNKKVEVWENRLGFKAKPRVAIVWSSASAFKSDSKRSIKLEQFIQCLPENQYELICLQKVLKDEDKDFFREYGRISFYGDQLNDFSDTAALLSCTDLIISVDTSVAHLGGALGIPTWILLPFSSDWRWLQDRTDSPWYPSVKLFRQKEIANWDEVLQRVRNEIIAELK